MMDSNNLSKENIEQEATNAVVKALVLGTDMSSMPSNSVNIDYLFESFGGAKVVIPPFDPVIWSFTPENSPRLARAVSAWSRNTVGLGWKIVAKDFSGSPVNLSDKKNKKEKAQFEKERELLLRLFKFPNSQMPFITLMTLIKIDEETTGNAYLEVVRNNEGRITSLYHVPSISVRALQNGQGYVQIKGLQFNANADSPNNLLTRFIDENKQPTFVYFKNFGDKRVMHKLTGNFGGKIGLNNRASEIIHFKLYSPRSSVYGVPRYVSAAAAIAGNKLAAKRNVTFFENDAVPRALLTVTGGQLDPDSIGLVQQFFKNQSQGVANAGRLLLLQLASKPMGFEKGGGPQIDFKPLTVGVTEDASYLAYKAANDEEIREVMELAEVYFSVDLVNRSSAEASKSVTEAQSFEPDRILKEFIINNTIVADYGWNSSSGNSPGIEIAHLEFLRPESLDPMESAQIDAIHSDLAVKTVNELRIELGLDPYPSDFGFGDKPLVVALAEMQAGISPTTGDPEFFNNIREEAAAAAEKQNAQKVNTTSLKSKDLSNLSGLVKQIRSSYISKNVDNPEKDAIIERLEQLENKLEILSKKTKKS